MRYLIPVLALIVACRGSSSHTGLDTAGLDTADADTDTDADSDTDSDTDADSDRDTDTDTAVDADGDGIPAGEDCDDNDPNIAPNLPELCNGVDDNCDGSVGFADADQDTYAACIDCNDNNAAIHPGATEIPYDGVDNDCSSATKDDDLDGDGFIKANDCDDNAASVNPSASEVCDGVDENCDGMSAISTAPAVRAGSQSAGVSARWRYTPTSAGNGVIDANWAAISGADGYDVAIGTTPGGTNVRGYTGVGNVTSAQITGLTLQGAWTDTTYYVRVRPTFAGLKCATGTSGALGVAEAVQFTGDVAALRPTDAKGGFTVNWPTNGVNAVYGKHWFETVSIASGTTVAV